MQRVPFNLASIRAARELHSGVRPEVIGRTYGLSDQHLESIASTYRGVPDAVLARIERLLDDRERLRHMIATLLHAGARELRIPR